MRWLLKRVSLLAACFCGPAAAQDLEQVPEHRLQESRAKAALAAKWYASLESQAQTTLPIDVTFYALKLDLDPPTRTVRGDVRIEARIGPVALSSVVLDLDVPMHVDSVRVGGAAAGFQHTSDDLIVNLGSNHPPGQPVVVQVYYAGVPDAASALHFDTRNGQPLVWTLSEPFGARTWWPCQDTPADKADSLDVDLTVPSTLIAVSEGKLDGTSTVGSKKTYRWRERYPITPYLVSIAAHPYTVQSTTYTPLAGGSMPVTLWSYPDQAGLATPLLGTTVQILQRFAGLFGEYPFVREKYGMAQFLWSGGMEHETATSVCCWSTNLTVHETAHQWFGDAVTCESFSHVWLNEGFATYCEALWDEGIGGLAAYRANIWANRFYGNGTIYVPPSEFGNFGRVFDGNLSYNKASWVLHMLRGQLGDATFFQVLRSYLADTRFSYGTATTEDFQDVAESLSGRDLSQFFARWIYTPYFPTYLHRFTAAPEAGGWRVDLSLEQLQTQGLYALPLTVRVTTTLGNQDFVVQDSLQQQSFTLHTTGQPSSILLDPDHAVLCTAEAALPAPSFSRGVLVVNGVAWSVGTEITSAYADSVFTAGYPFEFWDSFAAPAGGYVAQLPAPRGHGALPGDVLQNYSTVVWVGDADLDTWNNAALVSYLRAGGNLLLLSRRGQEFLYPARSSRLGLRWAESANATLASATAAYPGFVSMTPTNTQSNCAVFETVFDAPGTALLLTESQSFGVPRGIAAWRHPATGGTLKSNGAHFAFISGRPYRWTHAALRTNVRTVLAQLFGEHRTPTGAGPGTPAFTVLHAPAPNPFNPAVRVRFDLAQSGRARLRVYDPSGRLVRTLVDADRHAGPWTADWDGRDDRGRDAPSGLYFLRLDAAGTTRTQKATLVR
jgi:aminopeptidase N